jgi:hypothetical protein
MKFKNQKSTIARPEKRSSNLLSYYMTFVLMLFVFSPRLSFGQGYVEGVNISYEHMPMKIETPAGDQKFTGSNLKIATSIPIFLTPDKSKYLIVGGNLEAFNFSGTHPDFEVKRVCSISPTIHPNRNTNCRSSSKDLC